MDYTYASVIMPIRNEEKFIEQTLGAVLNQDYPPDRYEIIVVDGMSTDQTCAVMAKMVGYERVKLLTNPEIIQAVALNLGIQAAQGEIIIRVDGHTVIAPDFVRQSIRLLQETDAACVGGPISPIGLTPMGKAIAAASHSVFAVPTAFRVQHKAQFTDMVYLGAWRKDLLVSIGLFNEGLVMNEDYELNYRIRKQGGKIYLSPDIRSEYFGRQTMHDLALQYYRYGLWKLTMLRQHPASIRLRQVIAPLFVLMLFFGLCFGLWNQQLLLLWLVLVFAYLTLDLIFSVITAARFGWGLIFILPLVFPIYHLAWGSGFWVGLLTRHNALKTVRKV